MSFDEEQQRRSRVVVETPTARREVVQTETSRVPERQGISTGAVAALVVGAIALTAILFMFLTNNRESDNTNVSVATAPTPVPQTTTIIQQPAPQQQQPPVIIQAPPTTTQPAPIVVTPPATTDSSSSSSAPATTSGVTDDATVQLNVDKKIDDDITLSTLGITTRVLDGKVTLEGTVKSENLKRQVERLVKTVKGVRTVDNQIIVTAGMQ